MLGRGDLATSLLFVFPLFVLYEIGVIFAPAMNGVDFVTRNLFAAVGYSKRNYLLLQLLLVGLFAVFLAYLRSRKVFHGRRFLPMLLEAGIYALTLGTLILFVMYRLLHMNPQLGIGAVGAGSKLILSVGAGVFEELVFRLGLLSGGAALARLAGLKHAPSVILAFVVSSAVFSAAHHIGAGGDPFTVHVFVYRMFAGLVFGAVYYYRSLGHAVYTHALYDIYVMLLR